MTQEGPKNWRANGVKKNKRKNSHWLIEDGIRTKNGEPFEKNNAEVGLHQGLAEQPKGGGGRSQTQQHVWGGGKNEKGEKKQKKNIDSGEGGGPTCVWRKIKTV